MLVSDSQREGIAALLLISLIFYGASLHRSQLDLRQSPPSWGDQRPDSLVVEVLTARPGNGIYFLKDKGTIEAIGEIAGIAGSGELQGMEKIVLSPGSTLTIKAGGEVEIGEMVSAKKLALGLPLDLNRASREDLALVPGIGEKTAASIVQMRNQSGEFKDLSDLMALPGIKENRLNALKGYLTIGKAP